VCEEKASCTRSFSAVVVGVGTTLSVFGPILSSFLELAEDFLDFENLL